MVPASEQWIWRTDRVISNDAAASRSLLLEILGKIESQGWIQQDIFAVHLAVEEALANAIQHGNQFDPNKHIRIGCRLSSDRICVEIADEGAGFDPHSLPDPTCFDRLRSPRGRGVMLMKAFMSRVEFNAAGNAVLLEKIRSSAE